MINQDLEEIGRRERRRERITSTDSLNRPPFASPLASTEMDRKMGEKAEMLPNPCKDRC